MKTTFVALCSALFLAAIPLSSHAQVIWNVGSNDNAQAVSLRGGGPNAAFVQEANGITPLPGNPFNVPTVPATPSADNDYYFAGVYSNTIPSVVSFYSAYAPVGVVSTNEEAAERAFAGTDNDLRYHFNLPSSLSSTSLLSVTLDAISLDTGAGNTNPRYGVEVYFNGILVQTQILIRPPQIGIAYTSPTFTLASVNAQTGPGFDNIVSLKGYNYGATAGGQWMGFDYVQLNAPTNASPAVDIPPGNFPWGVGKDDNTHAIAGNNGGGTNTAFVQENGSVNSLPGNPFNVPTVPASQSADNDYYFAGLYTTTIASVTSRYGTNYTPVGLVSTNEEAAQRAFAGTDNDLRYHFNLPQTAAPTDLVSVSFDPLDLDTAAANTDPRYGVEIYFNGVLVQPQTIIRPAQLGKKFSTLSFSLASVNAAIGPGFDNIVTLRGTNYSSTGGGNWMGIDYVTLEKGFAIPPAVLPWSVGRNDDAWPFGDGGGTNASFVAENGISNALPGSATSEESDFSADNDYYFAGLYTSVIPGNGTYVPVGLVSTNEEAAERGFSDAGNNLRYHFNLPSTLLSNDLLSVTFDALSLDTAGSDPRYGVAVYFNNVLVQTQIVIRAAQLGQAITTPKFTLASVNAQVGPGFDNIVTLRGFSYSAQNGGNGIGFDYVKLDPDPKTPFPWGVGRDDNTHLRTIGTGGGTNANFWQEQGTINPLPGNPASPEADQQSDNDYYLAGIYTETIPSVTNFYNRVYTPVGAVVANEGGAERAFAGGDLDLRYHFNLPATLRSNDFLRVTWDALDLDGTGAPDAAQRRFGCEVYFNGVLVQTQVVIRPPLLNVAQVSPPFTLASVNARTGPGFDNIVSLKGISYNSQGGGNWMGIDYVKLDPSTPPSTNVVPQIVFPWGVGRDDNTHITTGTGGGTNANFVQENGTVNALPGNPNSPATNRLADNDYYLAGVYTNTIPSVVSFYNAYTPVGVVSVNENAAERAFVPGDEDLRYHFNLPTNVNASTLVSVTAEPLDLDNTAGLTDPRYGIEIYFNGVLVQTQVVIRAPQLNIPIKTAPFTLGSVNARFGPGFDNIVTLKGRNFSTEGGGSWMGIDYVRLDQEVDASAITFPWGVGKNDNTHLRTIGTGGGTNANFWQEGGGLNLLPGSPTSPEADQQNDNDYYFAGQYTSTIPSLTNFYNRAYTPVGTVVANEGGAERAFVPGDNDKRYHFNLPATLGSNDLLRVTWDALDLDTTGGPDPALRRYGAEVYFNGILVQTQRVIRPADLNVAQVSAPFSLASVNARTGLGFDNVVTLRGINYNSDGGGSWMGIDYVRLDPAVDTNAVPTTPFVTKASQGTANHWGNAIWSNPPSAVATSPVAGAKYEAIANGILYGNATANTRLRNPASGSGDAVIGVKTFPGDSLTLNAGTDIRAKGPGNILNFPGVGGNPGLILNGGALNPGDNGAFGLTGRVLVASASLFAMGDNGLGALMDRTWLVTASLSGSNSLTIVQGVTTNASAPSVDVLSANNTYSGAWNVKAGYLRGTGSNSLGSGNIVVDGSLTVPAGIIDPATVLSNGPALFEVNYNLNTPGRLTLGANAQMILHQTITVGGLTINGANVANGTYTFAQLAAQYPASFAAGGSGSITVNGPITVVGIAMPTNRVVQAPLTTAGGSLRGEFWKRPVWSIATDGNTNPTNRVDEQIKRFGSPSGRFSARSFVYLGNDLTPVTNWLGADGASYVGPTNNLDDGAFRFTGFVNITNAGAVLNIGLNSDDGSRLRIGGIDIIDDDGGHGDQTRDTNITFTAAGLYPIEITYFNGDWTSDNGPGGVPVNHSGNPDPGVHGGANFHLRLNGADITAAGASILHPPSAVGTEVPANLSVRSALTTSGGSLRGEYWKRPVWSIATDGNTVASNRVDEQIKRFGSPSGTFSARSFVYLGNDLTPVTNWLAGDGASFVGPTNNLDDAGFRFTGFINVTNPTVLNIGLNSDDGSRLRIGGVDILDNDGGHGDQTRDTNITFTAAGLYPIEITYFNGDWTSDNGPGGTPVNHSGNPDPSVHGGANFHLRLNGADITAAGASILHPPSALGPPANIIWVSFHAGDTNPSAAATTAGFTQAPDVGYTELLRAYGHSVTRIVSADNAGLNSNTLNAADLVIISRSAPSGHYQTDAETAFFNSISTPTMVLSAFLVRGGASANSRLGYMVGDTTVDVASNVLRLTINNPVSPIFAGIGLNASNTMVNPYAHRVTFTNNLQVGISTVTGATAGGGTVLATDGVGGDPAFGNLVIGEWPAGATMNTTNNGGPADILGGRRMLFFTGSRETGGLTAEGSGIYDLDPDGAQMFVNAVRYMARTPVGPTLEFARTGPLTPPRKGTNVTLSWPLTTDTGFVLQSKATITNTIWTNVPGVISNSITLSNQTGSGIFRLFKP